MQISKGSVAYEKGKELLNERAIKRRLKVLTENNLIDYADLPVDGNYLNEINKTGIDIIAKSRWLNGVSAYLKKSQLDKVAALEFVSQIKAVNKIYKQNSEKIHPTFLKLKLQRKIQEIYTITEIH